MQVLTFARYILEMSLLDYKFNVETSESRLVTVIKRISSTTTPQKYKFLKSLLQSGHHMCALDHSTFKESTYGEATLCHLAKLLSLFISAKVVRAKLLGEGMELT
jgi:hypothetical protein